MATFTVNFTLSQDFLQGSLEVEAADADEAIQGVSDMDPADLIKHTSETRWSIDAWVDGEE